MKLAFALSLEKETDGFIGRGEKETEKKEGNYMISGLVHLPHHLVYC
jgi:hypothetical protein